MKRVLNFVLAFCMVFTLFAAFAIGTSAADEPENATVVSAVTSDRSSWKAVVTFSQPVHIFSNGHVWLADSPRPTHPDCSATHPDRCCYQTAVSGITYIDPVTGPDDLEYSTKVEIAFADPYAEGVDSLGFKSSYDPSVPAISVTGIPEGAGIRFVEYGMFTGADGLLVTDVIKTIDGGRLVAEAENDGGTDAAWVVITDAPAETDPPADTDAPNPPATADFTVAIAAVAILALGATVIARKKAN